MERVIIFPEEVVNVIYQIIAIDEPNRDIVCADKNRAIWLFHLYSFIKIVPFKKIETMAIIYHSP